MSDIFISYAKEDAPSAKILADALERSGFSVWWDRNIPPGKTWDEVIGNALDTAACVLVLWSKISVSSRWVREEAERAANRKRLIPVLVELVELPFGYGRIQAADLTKWRGDESAIEFRELKAAVSELLGKPVTQIMPDQEDRSRAVGFGSRSATTNDARSIWRKKGKVLLIITATIFASVVGAFFVQRSAHFRGSASRNPATLDEDFGSGIGPFNFGMTASEVNSLLPRQFANGSLPVAGEFKSAEVKYITVNVSEFQSPTSPGSAFHAFRSWSSCWKGQTYVVFLFLEEKFQEEKLFRISLRLYPDCGEREALLRSFAQEFGLGSFNPSGPTAFEVPLKATTVKGTITQDRTAVDVFTNRSPQPL